MTSRAARKQPVAYAELPAAVDAHLIYRGVDTPLQAAQRHIQKIGHEFFQPATSPERVNAILAELERATQNSDQGIAAVAIHVLDRTKVFSEHIKAHTIAKPGSGEVIVLQQQRPVQGGEAMKLQPQL